MNHRQSAGRGVLSCIAIATAIVAAVVQVSGLIAEPLPSATWSAVFWIIAAAGAITALAVLWTSSRLALLLALAANLASLTLWVISREGGLPDGGTVWHPEFVAVPDLFLPVLEAAAAFLFLCLLLRAVDAPPSFDRVLRLLPWIALAALVVWAVVDIRLVQVLLAVLILDADVPRSLFFLFVPALAIFVFFLMARLVSPRLRTRTPWAVGFGLAFLPVLLVLNLFLAGALKSARDTAWFSHATSITIPSGQYATLAYCWQSGHPLAMDLAQPSRPRGPVPVVFFIHGGETLLGSRRLWDGSQDGRYFSGLRQALLHEGFAVGSIDYVLAPLYPRGDEIRNAKCAVRFLRAHAKALNIDPSRIGVFGPSQGGYLSAMLGTVPREAGLDVGEYPDQSSAVEAVVDMWGPMDLANFSGSPKWVSAFTQGNSTAALRSVSPINYVAPGDPPFLIIHGTDDWFIAPHHSVDMTRALRTAKVSVRLILVRNDGHGLAAATAGKLETPAPDALVDTITEFFVRALGRPYARTASPQ